MTAQVLIIETFADAYARHLTERFPAIVVHTAATASKVDVALDQIDVLIAFGVAIDNAILEKATCLKWIQSLATGVDHFLRCPALKSDTTLTSGRGIHGAPMRETVAFLMLSLARKAPQLARNQAAHRWDRGSPWSLLAGKTAVLVGVGVSTIAIGQLLAAFGMRVLAASRTPREVEGFDRIESTARLPMLVGEADYVINVLPGSKENTGLIGRNVFDAMKPTAYFINVGRGETVDEDALINAVRDRRIAGAGLDVFLREPLAAESALWDLDGVIISPHVAGYVAEYEQLVMPIVEENMSLFLAGRYADMSNIVPH